MAAPAEVSKRRSNFRIRQFKEKRHFNIATNLMLNTMVSFVILLIARTARIACVDGQTDRHTDKHTHETTTVTLSAHARRGLNMGITTTLGHTLLYIKFISYRKSTIPATPIFVHYSITTTSLAIFKFS